MEDVEIYKVYVKTDDQGRIYAVTSSAFLADPTGWTQIDEGTDTRYRFAQTQYFGETIAQDGILAQALLEDWEQLPLGQRTRARTSEEISADRAAMVPPVTPQEQLRADVDFLAAITGVSL